MLSETLSPLSNISLKLIGNTKYYWVWQWSYFKCISTIALRTGLWTTFRMVAVVGFEPTSAGYEPTKETAPLYRDINKSPLYKWFWWGDFATHLGLNDTAPDFIWILHLC